ncbi:MAG: N-acetyltransferase [Rubrobacter sp.]|nr:N-acetyltransferase [Rubrobacter sp.]
MKMRDAVGKDLSAIVGIYNSTIPSRVVSADTEPVSVEQRSEWFREHEPLRRPIWVMEDGGEVVGWLSLSDFYDARPAYHATAEIGVYVREDYRGKGVGRRLVEEAVRRGHELGLNTLTAGAFAHNEASVRLFEGMGFRKWAHFPRVAELDGIARDLVVLGLRLDEKAPGEEINV